MACACIEFYYSRVPPNVYFQIDDAESEWTFAKDSFDLIHIRHLSGSIKDWGALIEQAYKWVTIYTYVGPLVDV